MCAPPVARKNEVNGLLQWRLEWRKKQTSSIMAHVFDYLWNFIWSLCSGRRTGGQSGRHKTFYWAMHRSGRAYTKREQKTPVPFLGSSKNWFKVANTEERNKKEFPHLLATAPTHPTDQAPNCGHRYQTVFIYQLPSMANKTHRTNPHFSLQARARSTAVELWTVFRCRGKIDFS